MPALRGEEAKWPTLGEAAKIVKPKNKKEREKVEVDLLRKAAGLPPLEKGKKE